MSALPPKADIPTDLASPPHGKRHGNHQIVVYRLTLEPGMPAPANGN